MVELHRGIFTELLWPGDILNCFREKLKWILSPPPDFNKKEYNWNEIQGYCVNEKSSYFEIGTN